MFGLFRRKSAKPAEIEQVVHESTWSEAEIPRYPPFMKGLPVIAPTRLLETQQELIGRIRNSALATPEIFERYYLSIIRRYATYIHLLPASQAHHHRGAGGLLRHALEVGLWALQASDKVIIKDARSPAHRREMEPRWQLAVFMAALCHDAGKPVTDATITNKDRTKIWNPLTNPLYEWATENDLQAYYIEWREGRGRSHTSLSSLVADRIFGTEAVAWINEGKTDFVVWLMESLAGNPGAQNLIHPLVIQADQASVERDMRTMGVAMAGYDIGVPVERHVTDMMRRMVRESRWLVNEPGARVWNIEGAIYLIWPAAGDELAKEAREESIPGIPRTADGMLDMLVERKMAFMLYEDEKPVLWEIAPTILVEKIPDIRLKAIRLKDDTLVSSQPLPHVPGKILRGEILEASVDASSEPIPAAHADHIAAAPASESKESAHESAAATEPDKECQPQAEAVAPQKAEETKAPAVEKLAPVVATKPPVSQAPRQQAKPAKLDGATGEALKALAQDIRDGDKKWGVDAIKSKSGTVLLSWPKAFAGYGLPAKTVLEDMTAKGWLQLDASNPLKKTVMAAFDGGEANAIELSPSASMAFLAEQGAVVEPIQPVADNAIEAASISERETEPGAAASSSNEALSKHVEADDGAQRKPRKRKRKVGRPEQATIPLHDEHDSAGEAPEAPLEAISEVISQLEGEVQAGEAVVQAGGALTLDETGDSSPMASIDVDYVLEILRTLPATANAGMYELPMKAVVIELREKNIPLHKYQHFRALAAMSGGRIFAEPGKLKFKP